jgi:hypothetical protein
MKEGDMSHGQFDIEKFRQCAEAVNSERLYQEERWTGSDVEGVHEVDAFLTYIRTYLRQAEEIATVLPKETSDEATRRILRKIAALCFAACEHNGGMPIRATDPEWLSISKRYPR